MGHPRLVDFHITSESSLFDNERLRRASAVFSDQSVNAPMRLASSLKLDLCCEWLLVTLRILNAADSPRMADYQLPERWKPMTDLITRDNNVLDLSEQRDWHSDSLPTRFATASSTAIRYRQGRTNSVTICSHLQTEDYVVQPYAEVRMPLLWPEI